VGAPLSHSEYEQLAAGWVLGALEPEDEVTFQRHLTTCAACEESVRELEGVVGDLAYAAAPVEPPAELWGSIRQEIAPTARSGRARVARPLSRRAGRSPWPLRLAAAACLLLLVALSVWNVALRDQNDVYRAQLATLEQITTLMSDPSTRAIAMKGSAAKRGARATVLVSSRLDRGVLLVDELPAAGRGRVYQFWCLPEGDVDRAVPAGVFAGERGQQVTFAGAIQPTMAYAVTREPAPQGSKKPTSQPILIGSPPARA
jgi:anti-sigma-K factor RskA